MVTEAQMGEPESLEGKVLGGRYRLEHQLGEGGFGTIWRAEQLVLGATVAIKLIDLAIARQAGALDRFLREAQAAAALRSPHVVQVLDYGVDGDQPFIAMELLEGETLAQRLHRLGRLAPSEALRIVTQVARAMTRAHESNIVHRDLKPENVFLVHNEDEEVTKVLDFGVAKIKNADWMEESSQTRTGSLIGTPHYMSPEQVQGNKAVDYRSDLWSLGVIAFEMFTGQRPFVGNALGDLVLQICVRELPIPSRLAPVPAGFDDWFAKAAERDPERRFQSARDLAAALRDVVGGGERDIELVASQDMDPLREALTRSSAASAGSVDTNTDPDASPIQFAKTMRGDPTVTSTAAERTEVDALPSLHTADTGVTSERGLGRIVFAATAALLVVLVSVGVLWRNKYGAATRTNFVTASAIAPTTTPATRAAASASGAAAALATNTGQNEAAAGTALERSVAKPVTQKRTQTSATKTRARARVEAVTGARSTGTAKPTPTHGTEVTGADAHGSSSPVASPAMESDATPTSRNGESSSTAPVAPPQEWMQ